MKKVLESVAMTFLIGIMACGGRNGGGPTGPDFPDLRGTYSGTWSIELREVQSGETASVSCSGSVSVTSQSGSSFSGSFLIRRSADCDDESGTITGTVRSDGGLTLTTDVPGGDPNAFEDLTGCTVLSGDSAFTGIAAGRSISFDASFTTDCPTEVGVLRVVWTLRFQGSR